MQNTTEVGDARGIQANLLLSDCHGSNTNLKESPLLNHVTSNFYTNTYQGLGTYFHPVLLPFFCPTNYSSKYSFSASLQGPYCCKWAGLLKGSEEHLEPDRGQTK